MASLALLARVRAACRAAEASVHHRGRERDGEDPLAFRERRGDYATYFSRMDRTIPMKVGQLLPVFPTTAGSRLCEMGAGTGTQAAAYAAFHPQLLVVATDLDPTAVEHARAGFDLPNVAFLQADALASTWPDGFFDAVVDSSMGHHLVSFGGRGFDERNIERYRALVFAALKPGGKYGMRDFVSPRWPVRVELALPTAPGSRPGPIGTLSRAALFEAFARAFRSHDFPSGVPFRRRPVREAGWARYEVSGEGAANFLLRVDYTQSWKEELAEQYTYQTLAEHVTSLRGAGFRVDYAAEVHNPWILAHWWEGRARVATLGGRALGFPPTNFVVYATRPGPETPRLLEVADGGVEALQSPSFMQLAAHRHRRTGQVFDLVEVPGVTHAYFPYERDEDRVFLYVLHEAERPALVYYQRESRLNQSYYGGYAAEGLAQVSPEQSDPRGGFDRTLQRKAQVRLEERVLERLAVERRAPFLPSPGASDELIVPCYVELGGAGGHLFSRGRMKRVELSQLLASAQVGALPDPRLELAAYTVGRALGVAWSPWLGAELPLVPAGALRARVAGYAAAAGPRAASFVPAGRPSGFARLERVAFARRRGDAREAESSERVTLELLSPAPTRASVDTYAVVPYALVREALLVGLERRELPAFQQRGLSSRVAVVPAWRVPRRFTDGASARRWASRRLEAEFGVRVRALRPLGEGYFPSPGQTPERVTPFAAAVELAGDRPRGLRFVALETLLAELEAIPDLHSRVLLLRLAHATGRLAGRAPA